MSRRFVLVTATCTEQNAPTKNSAGIRKLKRGFAFDEFVAEYLKPWTDSLQELLIRETTTTAIARVDGQLLTWSFTEYPEEELISAVSHLTREELLRDLKELLPLKEMKR
jgi:hypothetical protein